MTAPREHRREIQPKLGSIEMRVLQFMQEQGRPITGIEAANHIGGWRRSWAYVALARLQRFGLVKAAWVTLYGEKPHREFTLPEMDGRS